MARGQGAPAAGLQRHHQPHVVDEEFAAWLGAWLMRTAGLLVIWEGSQGAQIVIWPGLRHGATTLS